MRFRITALDPARFAPLFALSDEDLARHLARRMIVAESPGTPCRVSLADAEPGEEVLLVNHTHLDAASPYRASHAVFVRRDAVRAEPAAGEVPEMLRRRTLSLRGFDADAMLVAADLAEGTDLAPALDRLLADPAVAHVDIHFARHGCYAARAERV
jgi:hypothetical protein